MKITWKKQILIVIVMLSRVVDASSPDLFLKSLDRSLDCSIVGASSVSAFGSQSPVTQGAEWRSITSEPASASDLAQLKHPLVEELIQLSTSTKGIDPARWCALSQQAIVYCQEQGNFQRGAMEQHGKALDALAQQMENISEAIDLCEANDGPEKAVLDASNEQLRFLLQTLSMLQLEYDRISSCFDEACYWGAQAHDEHEKFHEALLRRVPAHVMQMPTTGTAAKPSGEYSILDAEVWV